MQPRFYDFTSPSAFSKNIMRLSKTMWETITESATFATSTIQESIQTAGFNFILDRDNEIAKLRQAAADSKTSMIIKKIYLTNQHYGIFIPQSQDELSQVIRTADSKIDGRRTHHAFNFFSKDNFFSSTHPSTLHEHKILTKCLSHDLKAYTDELQNLCKEIFDENTMDFHQKISLLFFHLFSKMLFGFRFDKTELEILQKSIASIFYFHGDPFGPMTMKLSFKFRKMKSQYYQMVEKRLLAEAENVLEALHEFHNQKSLKINYLLNTLIELIKSDHPKLKDGIQEFLEEMTLTELIPYLKHPKILELPLILAGLSNLINVGKEIGFALQDILVRGDIVESFADHLMSDLPQKDDVLQRLCLLVLQNAAGQTVPRYFKTETSVGGRTIPAHTTLYINLMPVALLTQLDEITSLPRRFPLTPFLTGPRTCPAIAPSVTLIKELTLYLASKTQPVKLKMLLKAAAQGNLDVLQDLISSGIDLSHRDFQGDTALHIAIEHNRLDCVELLIKAGADLNSLNNSGFTPMNTAFEVGNYTCLKLLLEAGAKTDVGATMAFSDTPFNSSEFYKTSIPASSVEIKEKPDLSPKIGLEDTKFINFFKSSTMTSKDHDKIKNDNESEECNVISPTKFSPFEINTEDLTEMARHNSMKNHQ